MKKTRENKNIFINFTHRKNGRQIEWLMVLVLSAEGDVTTHEVLMWLAFYKRKYFRINQEDVVSVVSIDLESEDIVLRVRGEEINLKDVRSTWYRRGLFNFQPSSLLKAETADVVKALQQESSFLNTFIMMRLLGTAECINDYFSSHNNKLATLLEAKNVGLRIPKTYLTSYSGTLREAGDLVTKSIGTQYVAVDEANSTIEMAYTEKAKVGSDEFFFPSLFQEEIPKKLEIRVFFLLGDFYSMAIFSQSNPQTSTDFRKYDDNNPNRTVPFKLPAQIERKLKRLLMRLKLNCGSIDLIQNTKGEYVFLEVNPIGQFGMVSKPCNYYLEKIVAQKLSGHEQKN